MVVPWLVADGGRRHCVPQSAAAAAHQAAAAADLHSPQKAVEFVIAVCQCHVFYVALTVVDLVVFSNFLLHFVARKS